jgi:hypothetical protein
LISLRVRCSIKRDTLPRQAWDNNGIPEQSTPFVPCSCSWSSSATWHLAPRPRLVKADRCNQNVRQACMYTPLTDRLSNGPTRWRSITWRAPASRRLYALLLLCLIVSHCEWAACLRGVANRLARADSQARRFTRSVPCKTLWVVLFVHNQTKRS